MSEIANVPVNTKKSRTRIFVVVLSILVLLLVYGAGFVALPISILATYHNKNCDSALTWNKIYKNLYPEFIQDQSISTLIKECEAYALATSNEKKGIWQNAYDAYRTYSTTYLNGLYAKEVHDHSATVLLSLIKDQSEQKKYEQAVSNLNLIVSNCSDTNASAEAWTLFPATYTSWGAALRESGDFENAERVFNEFKTWSQTNQKPESTTNAESELAKTYLAWGQNLQSQKQYEGALAKLDTALSADPQSQSDSAAQVRSGQRRVYIEWGNDLLEQKDFSGAIEKFEHAVSKADGNTDDGAKDALANGHIQWAHDFSTREDFQAALQHLQTAKETALSDAMKKSVDTAFGDTYLAFSKSTGPQARRAMKEALKTVCEKHKAPDLPIFGLNKDSVRLGIYGVEEKLPENLAATTPGEMHYVACVHPENIVVGTRNRRNIILRVAGGYYYTLARQVRAQLIWNVILLKTDTIKNAGETTLTGGTPPPFTETSEGGYFYGPPPLAELSEWLQSVIQ